MDRRRLTELSRKLRRRLKPPDETAEFADFYVTNYGKQREKPQDKMRRKHEDK